jgi:hypothetical protein
MLKVFERSGLPYSTKIEPGTVHVRLQLMPSSAIN